MDKYKRFIQNNIFKISAPTWNHEFELTDGSYSASDIKDYFKYIILKHEAGSDNRLKTLYVNKIENKITVRIKTGGYYFEFFVP